MTSEESRRAEAGRIYLPNDESIMIERTKCMGEMGDFLLRRLKKLFEKSFLRIFKNLFSSPL